MSTIRELFDPDKPIDRRIEKVITYEATNEDLLKREVQEYVATDSIEEHFDRLLDQLEYGLDGGDIAQIGVWVSGFYGSGKSSFTKYLGFALDPKRRIEGKPFLKWLQNQLTSRPLRARLETMAKKHPAVVIMLDLASEQLAGATMVEISSVLYAKVMQWAGYARDAKVAYLEFMLEKDGRMADFQKDIQSLSKGKTWDEIKNQPLSVKALASQLAPKFYPELFPDRKAFNDIKIEEAIKEDDRVRQMLDLVKRKAGTDNIIFILDEVGQYVVARDDLILNMDGLAKNIKTIGKGKAWIIATAQQTLTEDDPRAATNTAKLFKLKDRFPVSIDLEASDIKVICYNRLLSKSSNGKSMLEDLFDRHGPQLRYATELKNTRYYKADLDKTTFCSFYPFLPHHFEILLQLLSRLAKSRGGVGLRSAIKVIQDVLVDPGGSRRGSGLLADEGVGALATTPIFFDTLRTDIQKPFPHIVNGVKRAAVYGPDSVHVNVAKSVAVLQILDDFPVSRENIAALMHPSVESASLLETVAGAVDDMLNNPEIPLNEVDGSLRFMSEAVMDLEQERQGINFRTTDINHLRNTILKDLFAGAPTVKLMNTRSVTTGFKIFSGAMQLSLMGDKEPIQTFIDFPGASDYDKRKEERILESRHQGSRNQVFLLGHEDKAIDDELVEIYRCREIFKQNRNKAMDKDVEEYLRAQSQRADNLTKDVETRLKKALLAGSFVFRGKPRAVQEMGEDIQSAIRKHLEGVAAEVFDKYAEAPVPADSSTAERFLKTEKLPQIPEKYDPLNLVKKTGGQTPIDVNHAAIISIRNYLEHHGQIDGRKLLDDFYAPNYGWSKDTTRYIVAAMLVAGVIKLRISGEDVTVRGEVAVNGLKNTNAFNKIGIALRHSGPDPEALLRACERLLILTGEEVMPLEEEISKCVMRHFPDLQQAYAPLAVQLKTLLLPGEDRAQSIQDNLAEILKGDASDAANRLGGEECPLFENLAWAQKVKKAFHNGIGGSVRTSRELMTEIPKLSPVEIPKRLIEKTEADRESLLENISREDFYDCMPAIQNRIAEIQSKVETAARLFLEKEVQKLDQEKTRLQEMPEWAHLGSEDKARLGSELDALMVQAELDLNGLKKMISDAYYLSNETKRIETEIIRLAEEPVDDGSETVIEITLNAPKMVSAVADLDQLIQQLEELKAQLNPETKIKITWR